MSEANGDEHVSGPESQPSIDPAPESAPDVEWQRLSARQLLIDPVKVLGQFAFPAAIAIFGISQGSGGIPLWIVPLVLVGAVAFGVIPWLTTYYRVTDTQFQLRQGLLNKKTKTAPLDRVRSVDMEANILHRILGLSKLTIGTGVDADQIELDSLAQERATELREGLLSRRGGTTTAHQSDVVGDLSGEPDGVSPTENLPHSPPAQQLATLDLSWVRFAPFSLSRLVVALGGIGFLSQFGDELPVDDYASEAWSWLSQFALLLLIPGLLVSALVSWVAAAATAYIIQWWNLRLTREAGTLHMTAGLFTTRSTTVEEKRVRGVELTEPVLMRLVGGGELQALATGREEGSARLLPACPVDVARELAAEIIEAPEPLTVPMTGHGPAARRRRWIRHGWAALVVAAAPWVAMYWLPVPLWLAVLTSLVAVILAAAVAEATYRHLGHALTDEHLVVGSGQTSRIRTVLETDGIIGWVVKQTYFQRRVGLATLVATTAAGSEQVVALDIPYERGLALANGATPGLLSEFGA